MRVAYNQHLLVVEYGFEHEARSPLRVRRHHQIDLMIKQCANAAKAKFLFDVEVHLRPARHEVRGDLQQPLVAGMAFHANAKPAAYTPRDTQQRLLRMLHLRQDMRGSIEQ